MHRKTPSFSSAITAIFSAIFIRPTVITANVCQLVIAGLLALALHLLSSPDGRMLSLIRTWAAASWFQISRNLTAYLPEWLAMRLSRAWSSSMDRARTRHTYILGMSGSGKSATMEMFLYRDVRKGHGIALIEPHGELADRFLHFDLFRLDHKGQAHQRLVLLDLESPEPTPFNIFRIPLPSAPVSRAIRIDELAASFLQALKLAIRPEMTEGMEAMLRNAITAVFHLPDPSFRDLIGILDDAGSLEARYHCLFEGLENPILRGYFEKDFFRPKADLTKLPLKDRLRNLLCSRQVQRAFLAEENAVDFEAILAEGKILVVRARKNVLGEDASRMASGHCCSVAWWISLMPDATFVIRSNRATPEGRFLESLFFVEIDMDTEAITGKRSLVDRFLKYQFAFSALGFRRLGPAYEQFSGARLLFVANSADRAARVAEKIVTNPALANAFLFTSLDEMTTKGVFNGIFLLSGTCSRVDINGRTTREARYFT